MRLITKFETIIEKVKVKRLLASLLIGVAAVGYASEYSADVHSDISSSVVRLHVIANSDSKYDQSLKLKARDAVIGYLKDKICDADNVAETKTIINNNLAEIKKAAEKELRQNNCNYKVECKTGVFKFPTKAYGNTKLPAGDYYALRVIIGEGKGKNWWCVLYPELCFGEIKEQELKNVLTDDAYNIITDSEGNIEYKFKFRLLELFGK